MRIFNNCCSYSLQNVDILLSDDGIHFESVLYTGKDWKGVEKVDFNIPSTAIAGVIFY